MNNNANDIAEALRALPELTPPAGQWQKILERAEQELPQDDAVIKRASHWYQWAGLAACLMLGVVLLLRTDSPPPEADIFSATPAPETAAVNALMRQSRLLEEVLRRSPPAPRVVPVGLASREAAMQDRIAAIDQRLSWGGGALDETERALLWGERTMMMKRLVQIRYSQTNTRNF